MFCYKEPQLHEFYKSKKQKFKIIVQLSTSFKKKTSDKHDMLAVPADHSLILTAEIPRKHSINFMWKGFNYQVPLDECHTIKDKFRVALQQ